MREAPETGYHIPTRNRVIAVAIDLFACSFMAVLKQLVEQLDALLHQRSRSPLPREVSWSRDVADGESAASSQKPISRCVARPRDTVEKDDEGHEPRPLPAMGRARGSLR